MLRILIAELRGRIVHEMECGRIQEEFAEAYGVSPTHRLLLHVKN